MEVRRREMAGATEMTEAVSRNAATIQGAHSRRWTEIHFSYQPTFESDYRAVRELYARRWGMGLEFLFMCAAVVVFALIVVFAAVLLGERGWLAVAKEGMSWWLLPGILAAILPTIQAGQVLLRRWSHPSCCEKLTFSINSREISVKGQTIQKSSYPTAGENLLSGVSTWNQPKESKSIYVPDVDKFPGHIACSSSSVSEIVVPILDSTGKVLGVLDVDSERYDVLDETDVFYLEKVCELIG